MADTEVIAQWQLLKKAQNKLDGFPFYNQTSLTNDFVLPPLSKRENRTNKTYSKDVQGIASKAILET